MRIPTIEHHRVRELSPWALNPREHDEDQVGRLTRSLSHFGLGALPVIQTGTRRILAGHGRIAALLEMGQGELMIPCAAMDLSTEDCEAYSIADNRLVDLSEWNLMDLREILAGLDNGAFPVEVTGFTADEIRALFGAPGNIEEADEVAPEEIGLIYEVELMGTKARVTGPSKREANAILKALCSALGYQKAE